MATPPRKSHDGAPDIRITGDDVSVQPGVGMPSSPHEGQERNLVENTARFRESPMDFLREVSLYVSGTGWRSYENVVGQPIFYNGFTDYIKNAVADSTILKKKLTSLAEERVKVEESQGMFRADDVFFEQKKTKRRLEIEESLKQVTSKMTDDMVCKMESKRFIRSAYYLVTKLLTRAYHQGIHVSSEEVVRLRKVAEKAAKDKQSIIFLPNHRSHVDYISLQLVCFRLGLTLPTVVAGDNLNFPLVGPFLQHAGAMWIRRSFGDDQLYVTLLQAYIDTLLQKGLNFECFIEGGRSRIGKLLPPKFGILGFLLDSVLSGRVEDAIICPVSTQYDKVVEVDSYITELLGIPKTKENLMDFFSASKVLSLKLGRVDVRFHEPWSLRGFINEQQQRLQSLSQAQQANLNKAYNSNLRIRLLRTLGYKVLADINDVSVMMPTALIGTVLLTLRGRGVGKTELCRRVEWLGERVIAHGGRVAHFGGATESIVERGLDVLGPQLVGVQTDVAEETYYAVDRFQLSFYRNMTIHLFISEALVSASVYTRVKAGGPVESQSIPYPELKNQVSFLSQLFRGEFIFRSEGLVANLHDTVQGLESDGVMRVTRQPSSDPNAKPAQDDADIQSIELSDAERENGRENFDFYCFLIWPFIEGAWLGAVSLLMLTPPADHQPSANGQPAWIDAKAFLNNAQLLGKTLYAQGDLSYFEAVNKETLKNAHTRFQEEGIIIVKKPPRGSSAPQMVRVAAEWMPVRGASGKLKPEGRLWDFCEEISRSRVEGKNRRDGDAVVGRTFRLVEAVGGELWEENVVHVGSTGAPTEGGLVSTAESDAARKEKRRRAPLRTRSTL